MKQTMQSIGGKNARIEMYLKPETSNEGLVSIKAFSDGHVRVFSSGADLPWQEMVAWLSTVIQEIANYYVS